ncbi:MAG: hypothetical protein KAI25_00230 [Hyphomicrobiaceae bacterium]|nr:hypothetical protein [Hyphomicrobiaceae bacterium]
MSAPWNASRPHQLLLTDTAWERLGRVAEARGLSRSKAADLLIRQGDVFTAITRVDEALAEVTAAEEAWDRGVSNR